jgi:hypothetical protein
MAPDCPDPPAGVGSPYIGAGRLVQWTEATGSGTDLGAKMAVLGEGSSPARRTDHCLGSWIHSNHRHTLARSIRADLCATVMPALAAIIGNATMFKSMMTIADKVLISLLAQLLFGTASYAQQTTGQLLISSGFNPIAATTPEMVARLNSFPANQFLLRSKGGRPYYVYADPSGCGCAYVGTVAAMDKYRASFGALPADTLSSGGFTNPEQNMINSMEQDDASAQFNNDVFGPNF